MDNTINQLNKYPYQYQNYGAGQLQQKLANNPATAGLNNTAAGGIANTATNTVKDNPAGFLKYAAIGVLSMLGADRLIGALTNNGKDSVVGKMNASADRFLKNHSAVNKFEIGVKNNTKSFRNWIVKNTPERIKKVLKYGYDRKSFGSGPLLKEDLEHKIAEATKNAAKDPKVAAELKALLNQKALLYQEGSILSKGLTRFLVGTKHFLGTAGGLGGGGFMGIAANGLFMGMSLNEASKAKKGEKVSTFMEDFIANWLLGFAIWTPAMKIVNGLSGLRFLGVDGVTVNKQFAKGILKGESIKGNLNIENIRKFEEELKTLKKQRSEVLSKEGHGFFKKLGIKFGLVKTTSKEYAALTNKMDGVVKNIWKEDAAIKAAIKLTRKGAQKIKWYERPLRLVGRILSTGHVSKVGYVVGGGASTTGKALRRFAGRGIFGVVLRGAALIALTAPITGIGKKISHAIFGKPTREHGKKEEATNTTPEAATKNAINEAIRQNAQGQPVNSDSNLFNKLVPTMTAKQAEQISQPVNTYMPASDHVDMPTKTIESMSPEFKKQDKKAEAAELEANEILKKYGGKHH